MLTITNTSLCRTLAAVRTYTERGAIITSVTSPHRGRWVVRLTWEKQ